VTTFLDLLTISPLVIFVKNSLLPWILQRILRAEIDEVIDSIEKSGGKIRCH
jgi:hypothetical protein